MKKFMTALSLLVIFSPQSFAKNGQKAIYGTFDNEFISMKAPQKIREMATGISYLVDKRLVSHQSATESVIYGQTLRERDNLCSDEKFSENTTAGFCTGFLVGKDIIVTAGHCVNEESTCKNTSFVFGVNSAREDNQQFKIRRDNVYSCKKVLTSFYKKGTSYDYAVIQLDREVKYRHVFVLGDDNKVTEKSKVAMLGHPNGLALTYSAPAPVAQAWDTHIFRARLDSFSGNSGSPVFDLATEKVMGILTGGQDDFEENGSCKNYAYYDYGSERITRISKIKKIVEDYNRKN